MLRRLAIIVTGVAITAAFTAGSTAGGGAAAQATLPGPSLRLLTTETAITAPENGSAPLYLDPGIWVASSGSALQLNVQRINYSSPITLTQVIKTPWGTIEHRSLPPALLHSWDGLNDFIQLTIRNSHGKVMATQGVIFCPDSYDPERMSPSSALSSPYPQQCDVNYGQSDPFLLSDVWGIARGWAVDPFETSTIKPIRLSVGNYTLTESITRPYARLFGISARAATATVRLKVVNGDSFKVVNGGTCCTSDRCCGKRTADRRAYGLPERALSSPPRVPTMTNPPRAALPQLTALPSWGISTAHQSGQDILDFGATVWVGGNSPLDVEGFLVPGTGVMRAYQYFWRNGKVIGRAEVGTMGFAGYNHWHFEQFARYALLNSAGRVAVLSHKVGFCIAPTDGVNLLLPHAAWQPPSIGLAGACGSPTALWVQEYLPIGWGDTYNQTVVGQAFDITNLPNGIYYIQIIANPLHKLHELSPAGNVSVRKVILGGTKGRRTVRVPAFDGIDPEG